MTEEDKKPWMEHAKRLIEAHKRLAETGYWDPILNPIRRKR